jgi:hypothetical protein
MIGPARTTAPEVDSATSCDLTPVVHRGYAVCEGLLDPDELSRRRAAIVDVVAELGWPALWAPARQPLTEVAAITPTGLGLMYPRPELDWSAPPAGMRAGLAALLGPDARIEAVGALVTDRSRPFFTWHTHIDGEDEDVRHRAGRWPSIARLRRVFTLLYLDDIDDDSGPLLVLPRREGDRCEPIADLDATEWPNQVVLRPRAGTLVVLDECTWHAARAMNRDGLRIFIGGYFASADTPPAPWVVGDMERVAGGS